MDDAEVTVFVVGAGGRSADEIRRILGGRPVRVESECALGAFLVQEETTRPACVVVDLRLDEPSGRTGFVEIRRASVPVLFVTPAQDAEASGNGASRGGVASGGTVLAKTLDAAQQRSRVRVIRDEVQARLRSLTPREREVMDGVVRGDSNRKIAAKFGISARTVEIHRAHMMEKLGVRSLAALVRLTYGTGVAMADVLRGEDRFGEEDRR